MGAVSVPRFFLLLLVTLCVSGQIPDTAEAGTYPVFACESTGDYANNGWTEVATADPVQVSSHSVCPAGTPDLYEVSTMRTGIGVFDNLGAPGDMPPDGTFIERRFDAPDGTAISRAVIGRDIGNADYWTPYGRIDGVDQATETCQRGYGQAYCQITGTRTFTGLNASRIAYGVRCHYAPYCSNGGTLHDVWVLVLRATVYLDDTEAPTVSTPTATGLADGAWHRAPGSISFAASDNTGIKSRRVLSGSTSVGSATAPNAAAGGCGGSTGVAYSYTRPCAGSRGLNGTQSVSVDPCVLGTGSHALRAAATDTGGTETQSSGTVTVKVDCSGPVASVSAGAAERLEGEQLEPTASATDPHAGVASIERQYRLGLGAWQPYTAPITVAAGVTYRFRARATDVVGNVGSWSESADVEGKLDAGAAPVADPVEAQPRPDERDPGLDPGLATLAVLPDPPVTVLDDPIRPRLTLSLTRATVSARRIRIVGRSSGAVRLTLTVAVRVRGRVTILRRTLTAKGGTYVAKLRLPKRLRGARLVRATVTAPDGVRARLRSRAR